MRCDDNSRHVPQAIINRQRLALEYVQHGTAQLTAVKRLLEIIDLHMLAATAIDHHCALGQKLEGGLAEYSLSCGCQRQQIDQCIEPR